MGVHGMITVKLTGFDEGIALFRKASKDFNRVAEEELLRFGKEAVVYLQDRARNNMFGLPPKKRNNGQPPLIDSAKYINGYVALIEKGTLVIFSEGTNDHMTNQALGELLEWGNASLNLPARPHIRPTAVWMRQRTPVLGRRIFDALFGSG